jgi:hypothetical protein
MPKEDSRKRRTEKTLTRLRAQAKEEDKKRIARLEAALEQSEEQLQDSTDLDNDLDPMDGVETDAPDQAVDGGQSSSSNSGQSSNSNSGQSSSSNSGSADATPAQAQGGNSNPQQVEANANPASTVKTEPDDDNDDDDTPLFVPETEPDPASEPEDPEYGAPLFTRPGPQLGDNVTTVGWTSGRKTQYINMYGKKSAARYRIEDAADTAEYDRRVRRFPADRRQEAAMRHAEEESIWRPQARQRQVGVYEASHALHLRCGVGGRRHRRQRSRLEAHRTVRGPSALARNLRTRRLGYRHVPRHERCQ